MKSGNSVGRKVLGIFAGIPLINHKYTNDDVEWESAFLPVLGKSTAAECSAASSKHLESLGPNLSAIAVYFEVKKKQNNSW